MATTGFSIMGDISESKLIPNRHTLGEYDSEELAELAFLHILTLRILLAEPDLRPFPQYYCRDTARFGNFTTWHINSTDLYVMLYGLIADAAKYPATTQRLRVPMPIDPLLVYRWLRAGADRHRDDSLTHRLFVKLDTMFRIKDSSMRAIRRLVMDWTAITTTERKLALTRLLQFMRQRAPRGELLPRLNRVAVLRDLELSDVDNPETGEAKPSSLLRTLARESASSGATAAANIASVAGALGNRAPGNHLLGSPSGTLGAGFDDDFSKSIYPPPAATGSPPVLRRGQPGAQKILTHKRPSS